MEAGAALTSTLELMRWTTWAQRKAGEELFRARELTPEQGQVLGYLAHSPGAIQRDIARITRRGAASVSSLLQGLERRALVQRRTEGGDERSKRVYATPEGLALVAGLDTAMADVERAILAPLTETERAALHDLLVKVTTQLPQPIAP